MPVAFLPSCDNQKCPLTGMGRWRQNHLKLRMAWTAYWEKQPSRKQRAPAYLSQESRVKGTDRRRPILESFQWMDSSSLSASRPLLMSFLLLEDGLIMIQSLAVFWSPDKGHNTAGHNMAQKSFPSLWVLLTWTISVPFWIPSHSVLSSCYCWPKWEAFSPVTRYLPEGGV